MSPAGFVVGTIRNTDGDSAIVGRTTADRDGLTEEIAEWLGWSDAAADTEIRREHVEAYGDGTVRLRDRHLTGLVPNGAAKRRAGGRHDVRPAGTGRIGHGHTGPSRTVLRSQAVPLRVRSPEGRVR